MRFIGHLLIFVTLTGCGAEAPDAPEPPLRPLVYTEGAADPEAHRAREAALLKSYEEGGQLPEADEIMLVTGPAGGAESFGDNILGELLPEGEGEEAAPGALAPVEVPEDGLDLPSPEALARVVFDAMVRQDADLYRRAIIDEQGLIDLAKVRPDTARQRVEALHNSAMSAFQVFSPVNPSEEPVGGLQPLLQFDAFKPGKPGTIWGKVPHPNEDTVQFWSSTIQYSLLSYKPDAPPDPKNRQEPPFTLTLGRVLRLPNGQWRLAAAPEVSAVFRAWLRAGLHFKPEMLQPEHHPFPLSVGNFWRYRVLRPETATELQGVQVLDATAEEVRLEVTDVKSFDGYRLVTLRRTHKHLDTTSEALHYLVTARRLYLCTTYCASRIKDLPYIISYTRFQSPLLTFPLKPGQSWGQGGVPTPKNDHQTRDAAALTSVPAGEFHDTLLVDRDFEGQRETRHFKPGVGVVQRVGQDKLGPYTEALIEYRLLTTE